MRYLWQIEQWPAFRWDDRVLAATLARASRKQGWLLGKMESLGFDLRREANLHSLTEDVVKSSAIEGESLPTDRVRSSLARRLGMEAGALAKADRDVDGVVAMMVDATENYDAPLTAERLFGWHASLFPTGRSGLRRITVGAWRTDDDGPMQVVSGPIGKETVHYEAPPAGRLADEMAAFLAWFEAPGVVDPLLISGLAHLWFVTIHPFDDGNGRIARAIADLALARAESTGQRFYSMSARLCAERDAYYTMLEQTQKADLDITAWQTWFLMQLLGAFDGAHGTLATVIEKARFWERFAKAPLNERQIAVLNRLLDGFEGKLTTSKWARLAKCSQDTAYRDILDLVERGALIKDSGGGRSTSYSIVRM